MSGWMFAIAATALLFVGFVIGVARRPLEEPRQVGAAAPPGQLDGPAYRNHLAMARWIEVTLKDDLVRSSIEAGDVERARRLLAEFYDEADGGPG